MIIVDAPANPAILQPGPFRNPLWPNAEQEAAEHKAHILVMGLKDPPDREAALVKARAVTWVTAALARYKPPVLRRPPSSLRSPTATEPDDSTIWPQHWLQQ